MAHANHQIAVYQKHRITVGMIDTQHPDFYRELALAEFKNRFSKYIRVLDNSEI
jgi:hypothetical protein